MRKGKRQKSNLERNLTRSAFLKLSNALMPFSFARAIKLQEEKQERARSLQEHEQRLAEKKRRADEIRMRHEKVNNLGYQRLI